MYLGTAKLKNQNVFIAAMCVTQPKCKQEVL